MPETPFSAILISVNEIVAIQNAKPSSRQPADLLFGILRGGDLVGSPKLPRQTCFDGNLVTRPSHADEGV
jgi:hypothetical protein